MSEGGREKREWRATAGPSPPSPGFMGMRRTHTPGRLRMRDKMKKQPESASRRDTHACMKSPCSRRTYKAMSTVAPMQYAHDSRAHDISVPYAHATCMNTPLCAHLYEDTVRTPLVRRHLGDVALPQQLAEHCGVGLVLGVGPRHVDRHGGRMQLQAVGERGRQPAHKRKVVIETALRLLHRLRHSDQFGG